MGNFLANAKPGDRFSLDPAHKHTVPYWLIGTSVFDQLRKIRMTMNVKRQYFFASRMFCQNARLTDSQLHVGAIKAVPESAAGLLEPKTLVGAETHLHKFVYGDTNCQ